jgi:hypothetical protein
VAGADCVDRLDAMDWKDVTRCSRASDGGVKLAGSGTPDHLGSGRDGSTGAEKR